MGGEGWHGELDVGAGFVEEVSQLGSRDDVGGAGASLADGGFDDVHAPVLFELANHIVSHFL
jgi:hypothetical protein